MKLALDFGTTNSLLARWDADRQAPELLRLPQLSAVNPPLIPSLAYVAAEGDLIIGQAVIEGGWHQQADHRLFRNFKRGMVASPAPDPRYVDGIAWDDKAIGERFIQQVVAQVDLDAVEQLVITVPVVAFQSYLDWLSGVFGAGMSDKIRIVDESTAAALGYAVTEAGATVLVFDFGGGTLDVSLVQLPETRQQTGGFLSRLKGTPDQSAKVIAKAGRIMGGSDVDQWLLSYVLDTLGITRGQLGADYAALLTTCEQAKIALSTAEEVLIQFMAEGREFTLLVTREDLEAILTEQGFYSSVRQVVDKVMYTARQRGIFKEDIQYVLLVGGMSLMPSVQTALQTYFSQNAVRADKPFTAIVEGALQVAAGYGLDDYLVHSYGLRYFDPITQTHQYDEILPMGTPCPTEEPVEVWLTTAHDNQREMELVIGEIDPDATAMIEVRYENGQTVYVAQGSTQQITALNAENPFILPLKKALSAGEKQFKAAFTVDANRQLHVTLSEGKAKKPFISSASITTLR